MRVIVCNCLDEIFTRKHENIGRSYLLRPAPEYNASTPFGSRSISSRPHQSAPNPLWCGSMTPRISQKHKPRQLGVACCDGVRLLLLNLILLKTTVSSPIFVYSLIMPITVNWEVSMMSKSLSEELAERLSDQQLSEMTPNLQQARELMTRKETDSYLGSSQKTENKAR